MTASAAAVDTDALTVQDAVDLERLEQVVAAGLSTFVQTGEALIEIHERALYRATHPTWAAYVTDRWGLSRSTVGRMLDAARLCRHLTAVGVPADQLPATDAEVRGMAPVIPASPTAGERGGTQRRATAEDAADAWRRARSAAAAAGRARPTGADVRQAVADAPAAVKPRPRTARPDLHRPPVPTSPSTGPTPSSTPTPRPEPPQAATGPSTGPFGADPGLDLEAVAIALVDQHGPVAAAAIARRVLALVG